MDTKPRYITTLVNDLFICEKKIRVLEMLIKVSETPEKKKELSHEELKLCALRDAIRQMEFSS